MKRLLSQDERVALCMLAEQHGDSSDLLNFINFIKETSKQYGWTHQQTLSILHNMPEDPNRWELN